MIKFVHIADVHLGYRQYGSDARLIDFAQAFYNAMNFAISKKVDFIIIAGDLFHKRSEMDPVTLTQATKVLELAKKAEIPVIGVEGNHDSTYFKESFSWMDYLAGNDLFINLKPSFEDGIVVEEWNGKNGAFVDLDGVRIYGMKYYGSLTSRILEDYKKEIRKKDFTIFTAHAGIEGYMNIYGCVPSSVLHGFERKVDYVALGHIHKSFVEKDFIFNPGSLENCDITEVNFEKGIFYVEWDGELRYKLIKGFSKRKFLLLSYTAKNDNFKEFLRNELKSRGIENSVVHINIKKSRQAKIKKEEIERVVHEFNPLVLRLKIESEDVFKPVAARRDDIEKDIIEQLLVNYRYGNIADEVLRLKSIFSSSFELKSVDEFIETILTKEKVKKERMEESEKIADNQEEVVKVKNRDKKRIKEQKEEEGEEWDWRGAIRNAG